MNLQPTHLIIFLITVLLCSCKERDKYGKLVDDPTSGHIRIAVDESLRPLVEAEVMAFEGIYKDAKVSPTYLSEPDAIEALLKDTVRLAVVTRRLTDQETDYFLNEQIEPVQIDIATSAVALIINRRNTDSLLSIGQLKGIMENTVTNWKQINTGSPSSSIEVIFDNPASGTMRLLQDSVSHINIFPSNFFAMNTNEEVINYVALKPNAIGVIGVEWISDKDDSTANGFLNTIRVMSLAVNGTFRKPYQAYISMRQYPLCRTITIISREARTGLGSGFIAFVASDKGQRIVLKAGLVPATMPIRIVEINRE